MNKCHICVAWSCQQSSPKLHTQTPRKGRHSSEKSPERLRAGLSFLFSSSAVPLAEAKLWITLQFFVSLSLTFLQQPFFLLMCFFHKNTFFFPPPLLCLFLWQISAIMLLPRHVKSFPPHLLLSFNPPPLIPPREQSRRKAHKMCN